jgi:hypothetical protein
MGAGALLGFIGDRYTSEETARFLTDVSMALTRGKYAIVADVLEGQMNHLSAMENALGRDQARAEQAELELQERIEALQRQK